MASIRANCRKVVCIGRNYADHITELASARPKQPFFFLKPPTSILIPGAGPIIRPRGVSLHYEVELGLVIGPRGATRRNLRLEDDDEAARDMIDGYFVGIDMTARNVQDEAKRKGLPWTAAKGFDTFLPISERIAKDRIPDPHEATLWLDVNGERRQHDSTSLMLFGIPRLLSDISMVMSLEEGDVVLTGTPKGVGEVRGGDVIRAGLQFRGEELDEGRIEVGVEEAGDGGYEYSEV